MKIKVVEPQAWMLTSVFDAGKQLALCAYGAGLSRGRVSDVYRIPTKVQDVFSRVGSPKEWHKTGDLKDFKDTEELLKKLMDYKPHPHESVIEHGSVSFLFQCSRIATHEIVRHRLCAFTQTSTRYIEEKDAVTFIKPPHMNEADLGEWNLPLKSRPTDDTPRWVTLAGEALFAYRGQRESGVKRESARYLLPHCLGCWIQITTNFRQWRHMIRLRTSKKAAPEMQRLFGQVKSKLTEVSSVLTEDL